jgi:hypothetical protein
MPFSKQAIEELEERLRNNERRTGTGFTNEELEETACLLTGLIAASLKMRQRFLRVGRPLRPKKHADERFKQGVLPGLEFDKRERRGTRRGRSS